MKKFEYKIVPIESKTKNFIVGIDIENTEAILTGEGLEGWEAVSTFAATVHSGQVIPHVLMKRVIKE